MGECAQNDDEHNAGWNPAVFLIRMDHSVSGKCDEERDKCNDQDTGESRNFAADSIQELGTHDGVGCRPTDTSDDIEDSDCESHIC